MQTTKVKANSFTIFDIARTPQNQIRNTLGFNPPTKSNLGNKTHKATQNLWNKLKLAAIWFRMRENLGYGQSRFGLHHGHGPLNHHDDDHGCAQPSR
jgi:hypothetical protein